VAVLRTWAALIAGAAEMSFTKFVTYNTIGSAVWAVMFGLLGYYFGRDLPLLEKYIARASFATVTAVGIGTVAFILLQRKRTDLS
jgi:membrane-associated protein